MLIFCIDLKSFYASVECSLLNLDPFKTPLVVADTSRGKGSIILAVTPFLKSKGVPSRCRIFELPKNEGIIFAKPKMSLYIEFSKRIYKIYLKYISKEDIHVYSIDEAFLDFTNYLRCYKMTPVELAKMIMDDIYKETKVTATCGIGENMFLAKVALDNLAKKEKTNISLLTKELFYEKVWPLKLGNIWGIGSRLEKRLNRLGYYTLGDVAKENELLLKKEFGVIGEEIYEHSWGIDNSKVADIKNYKAVNKSIGHSQVLFEDYNKDDLVIVLHEMVDELALKLVNLNLECRTISLYVGYSKTEEEKGFMSSKTILNHTNSARILYDEFKNLYFKNIKNFKIRSIRVSASNLASYYEHQANLFEDSVALEKENRLNKTVIEIKNKHGKNAINKASSLSEKATQIKRNKLIGGHNAE